MIELYFRLVKAKLRTCNKDNLNVRLVPEEFLEDVLQLLIMQGYDSDGNMLL